MSCKGQVAPPIKRYAQSKGRAEPAAVGATRIFDALLGDQHQGSSSSSGSSSKLRRTQSLPVLQPIAQPAQGLTEAHVRELRQMQRPPEIVRRALGAATLVIGARGGAQTPRLPVRWTEIKRTISSEDLLSVGRKELAALQSRPGLARRLSKEFVAPPGLQPLTQDRLHRASPAAAALFAWSTGISEKTGRRTKERSLEEQVNPSPRNPMVLNKCSCGFACGPEHIFAMHMKEVEGDPSHQRIISMILPATPVVAKHLPPKHLPAFPGADST